MTSIVLAGGKSSRLGQDKASEKIDGESLIERVISLVASLSSEVLVVVSEGQLSLNLTPRAKRVVDVRPGGGALVGIYSGLVSSDSFHNLVVACDMPFLNLSLLRYMIGLSPSFDAVVPRLREGLEPLHAVYSKNCLILIERRLKQGDLRVTGFLDEANVRYVEEGEVNRFDPEHLSFFNINTEADLERARVLAKRVPHDQR